MGCGISKFDIAEEGEASPYNQSSVVHRRSDRAVVDSSLLSKPLPEGGKGEEHVKGDIDKKVNSEEKGVIQRERVEKEEACNKEDSEEDRDDRDDGISDIRSPSFRVYCVPSQSEDENGEGDSNNPGKITKDKQLIDVKNDIKGSSSRWGKSSRRRKGIKTSSGKTKRSLKSLILQSMYQSS